MRTGSVATRGPCCAGSSPHKAAGPFLCAEDREGLLVSVCVCQDAAPALSVLCQSLARGLRLPTAPLPFALCFSSI